jgi:hypothetical protein
MGLAVTSALSQRGEWDIHILDINAKAGKTVAEQLSRTAFYQTNVTKYEESASTFRSIVGDPMESVWYIPVSSRSYMLHSGAIR